MDDELMHPDENDGLDSEPRPENESPRPGAKQFLPAEHPELDGDEISLLDLMADTAGVIPDDEETADLPLPSDDDAATLTGSPEPETPADGEPLPLPLSPDELTPPQKRPLINDTDATTIQPRVAFPGSRPPLSEAPTQMLQPIRRPKRDPKRPQKEDAPTIVSPALPTRPPVREQSRQPAASQRPAARPQPTTKVAIPRQKTVRPKPQTRRQRNWRSCFSQALLIIVVIGLLGTAVTLIGAYFGYRSIANDLPDPTELTSRASDFETARIYDRNGGLLYALIDPDAGDRTRVSLEQISPHLINATIATEDSRFYENPGFDPIGIARAVIAATREQELMGGASTITQQLVRAVLLEDDERSEVTFRRKVREIILAEELTRTYEKDVILELYLNEI